MSENERALASELNELNETNEFCEMSEQGERHCEMMILHSKNFGSQRARVVDNNLLRDVNITVASTQQYESECQKVQ